MKKKTLFVNQKHVTYFSPKESEKQDQHEGINIKRKFEKVEDTGPLKKRCKKGKENKQVSGTCKIGVAFS